MPIGYKVLYTLQSIRFLGNDGMQNSDIFCSEIWNLKFFIEYSDPTEIFEPINEGQTNHFIVILPKINVNYSERKIYDKSQHGSFPIGSRIAIRCAPNCPEIPWV